MKFAKELEQDLVPEWRLKYLDYKQGKKKVKAVARAAIRANTTPRTSAQYSTGLRARSTYGATTSFTPKFNERSYFRTTERESDVGSQSLRATPAPLGEDSRPESEDSLYSKLKKTPPISMAKNKRSPAPESSTSQYGSFVPTPPKKSRHFELPDPAVSPQSPLVRDFAAPTLATQRPDAPKRHQSISIPQNAYEVGRTTSPQHRSTFASLRNRIPHQDIRPIIRRVLSVGTPLTLAESNRLDVDLVVVDHVRQKQKEFFTWMDKELDKVEVFYKLKEDESGERLKILRDQLHEMRNRRIDEVAEAQRLRAIRRDDERAIFDFSKPKSSNKSKSVGDHSQAHSRDQLTAWLDPVERVLENAKSKVMGPHPGSNSKALQNMQESPELRSKIQSQQDRIGDDGRDYVRRHHQDDVPYRTAKRKLKLALQEFYRGMELLKSFALLNRTAFRKINKKYDKAVDAHPPLRYMSEKVNKAWFVQSDILDGHMHAVEDLYARYFERGNHKVATGKLRSGHGRPLDQSASAFRNGILIGVGAVFCLQGVIYGAELLHHEDLTIRTQASYLLQIYGGYFLALYLFSWFCLDCSIWTKNKINYQFVFEFDPRHNLDWRELSEFPSFLILVLGLFIWLNFSRYGSSVMFIYYPVILIFVTVVIIFIPAPIIFHRSRRWFVYSHWRLLLAGLYPVEFRDFFLGDMYCSLTYFTSNIELFFCLYAHYWNDPSQCNSTHSRLLGFFSTLPAIWRALQCLRRYYDTRNVFPHLVNCGKYMMTIMYYVCLSLYRIDRTYHMLALFITFATVNAIYCSFWDIFMDWSLFQPQAKKRFLRDIRGFKNPNWYYFAMLIDPILRFNWIFYAIYTHDLQHNTICSFLVALSEVTRRGMWTAFRVENEHSSNVARFKASRDVPLPYELETESQVSLPVAQEAATGQPDTLPPTTPSAIPQSRSRTSAVDSQDAETTSLHRRPTRTFTSILANAHTQDFEKKRKPGAGDSDKVANRRRDSESIGEDGGNSSDDDEDDDVVDVQDTMEAEGLVGSSPTRNGNAEGRGM